MLLCPGCLYNSEIDITSTPSRLGLLASHSLILVIASSQLCIQANSRRKRVLLNWSWTVMSATYFDTDLVTQLELLSLRQLVSHSQTTISENRWQSIHFNCSLIRLVVPEPEGVLVTWIHMTWSYLFCDVLCKFILCCSTIPLYTIVMSSVHLCDISHLFLLYSKILAVVLTLVIFYFALEWSVLMTSHPMLCFTDVQSYSNTKWLLMMP